jgi:hypothetical protein
MQTPALRNIRLFVPRRRLSPMQLGDLKNARSLLFRSPFNERLPLWGVIYFWIFPGFKQFFTLVRASFYSLNNRYLLSFMIFLFSFTLLCDKFSSASQNWMLAFVKIFGNVRKKLLWKLFVLEAFDFFRIYRLYLKFFKVGTCLTPFEELLFHFHIF